MYEGTQYEDTGFSELSLDGSLALLPGPALSDAELEQMFEILSTGKNMEQLGVLCAKMSAAQMRDVLTRGYYSLAAAGNDVRTWNFLSGSFTRVELIPVALQIALANPEVTLLRSESSDFDPSDSIATHAWGLRPEGIPFRKQASRGWYNSLYSILRTGDTRVVPEYLDIVRRENPWHEFCCSIMPSDLLRQQMDPYTRQVIEEFLKRDDLNPFVREEIEKALRPDQEE